VRAHVLQRVVNAVIFRILLWLAVLATLFPILWMILSSFKPPDIVQAIPPIWSFTPTLQNYNDALTGSTSLTALVVHSAIVATLATVLTLAAALPAAYALARIRFRGKHALASWILSTIMFPPVVSAIPVFIFVGQLGLMDTYPALVIPYTAFNLPVIIWLLRSFVRQVPQEIEEAALVDGSSRVGVVRRIVLPLVAPGLAAAAILSFLFSWNEFLFALTLTRSAVKTAPVGVSQFTGMYGTQWGDLTAASTVIAAPVLIMTLILRRRIVQGLTFGAVK
jgi:multiple sugar transport system permease protein/sorbitol/mannitol transport system permease protein